VSPWRIGRLDFGGIRALDRGGQQARAPGDRRRSAWRLICTGSMHDTERSSLNARKQGEHPAQFTRKGHCYEQLIMKYCETASSSNHDLLRSTANHYDVDFSGLSAVE
jgi:hypothetical protein